MPRPSVEVRRAGVDDVDDLLELWRTGRDELVRAGRPAPAPAQVRPRLVEALGGAADVEVLVARWDGRPAGFIVLRVAPVTLFAEAPALHVEQLFVAPELRRHGVARALLNGTVVRADRCGADQVVSSVLPWARETHRFFARLGFTPMVVRRVVTTSTLRRRLAQGSSRGPLEDLLSRRRSLRARARIAAAAGTGAALALARPGSSGVEAADPEQAAVEAAVEAALALPVEGAVDDGGALPPELAAELSAEVPSALATEPAVRPTVGGSA